MADSYVDMFNQFKIIHCMCPKCDDIIRVSDMQLYSKDEAETTWLDSFDADVRSLGEREDRFAEEATRLKEESVKRGRERVPGIINKSLDGNFARLKYDPYDIKAIHHPVDFVVFEGMNAGQVENVTLLSHGTRDPHMRDVHRAIEKAIDAKAYDWKVLRATEDGEITLK